MIWTASLVYQSEKSDHPDDIESFLQVKYFEIFIKIKRDEFSDFE